MNSQDDVVIVVMGSTGTGKSSFVKLLTGNTAVKIGNTLDSETSNVQVLRFVDPTSRRNVVIVDTPGFDDSRTSISDTQILTTITEFLLKEYDSRRKLNSLVYLQRISDPRFGAQSNRNLKVFRNLCGTENYKNMVILTTFWDQVDAEGEGLRRETQLESKFLKDIVEGGAYLMRHDRTTESARRVLEHILTLTPTNVHIQREIREEGKSLEDTAAGSVHREEVEHIIAKHKKDLADLKAEMEKMKGINKSLRRELEEERENLQQNLVRWESERSALKRGLREARDSRKQLQLNNEEQFDQDTTGTIMENPPPSYEQVYSLEPVPPGPRNNALQFSHTDHYPPFLKSIPRKLQTLEIFNFTSLVQTTAMLFINPSLLPKIRNRAPDSATTHTMQDLEERNSRLHNESRQSCNRDMYSNVNIGLRRDWYTDAVFGQQQFTGTNPTTITLAPRRWIEEFKAAARTQGRTDVATLLTEGAGSLFVQDYSYFRSAMGVHPTAEFTIEGRYGCASVVLFHLESEGKLHPVAITLDYKGDMEKSVTIFNSRTTSFAPGNEWGDWPWRYAKMCAQVSDWLRHEVTIHLINTHLTEEVLIVAAYRTFDPSHVVFNLLEPHWKTTLSLNKAARETLVPKIIIPLTGFTTTQVYSFIQNAYGTLDWTGSYVPNDLKKRGFPVQDLDKPKYHNYGYARNISRIWDIIRKFVSAVLREVYVGGDAQVACDMSISAFCQEVRAYSGGQLASFPIIKTLDQLIDFVTMGIHIASPQHTAVNYLQQYYQTFIPNKPSALCNQLPQSLEELEAFGESDILSALPIDRPRDWLVMAQVPYLLSFEVSDDSTIFHYAETTSSSFSARDCIRKAASVLRDDLEEFSRNTVSELNMDLDDQETPYYVLDPKRTAVSILI